MIHFYKRCVSSLHWQVAHLWVRSGWVSVFVSHKLSLFRTKESPLKYENKMKMKNKYLSFIICHSICSNQTCMAKSFVVTPKIWIVNCLRPYHAENTSSRLITEVKQHWVITMFDLHRLNGLPTRRPLLVCSAGFTWIVIGRQN